MKPLPKLSPAQQKLFEHELSSVISMPRWFVLFGTLEEDSANEGARGDPQLAAIRRSGMFTAEHQAIFEQKLSECCSAGRWFCVFGTLDDAADLRVRVRCMNLPPAGSERADFLHAAMERLVFEVLKQGEAWVRCLPVDEGIYRAIAREAWNGLEGRTRISRSGKVAGGADCAGGGRGGLIEGRLDLGGGVIIGHGVPKDRPENGE